MIALRHIYPIPVVEVENGGGWDDCKNLRLLAVESGPDEHAETHHAGIVGFDSNLHGTYIGVERRRDVTDPTLEHSAGIGVQPDVGELIQMNVCQIVLVDIAQNPHF